MPSGTGGSGASSQLDQPDPAAGAQPVPAAVDEDPVEPRVEPRGVAQVAEPRPGGDGRVLDGVLGLELAAEQHGGQPVRTHEVAVGERDERGLSTGHAVDAQDRLLVDGQPPIAHARPDDGTIVRVKNRGWPVALWHGWRPGGIMVP